MCRRNFYLCPYITTAVNTFCVHTACKYMKTKQLYFYKDFKELLRLSIKS